MISLLVTLLLLAVVLFVIKLIIDQIPLPPVVKTIAYLIVGLIALVYVLSLFGVNLPLNTPLVK